jgi:predicted kinase
MTATFVMGLPGSGKSTYCKTLDGIIINRDAIRMMIYGKYDFRKEDEPMVFEMALSCAKHALIGYDKDIIIDETGANVMHRIRWCEELKGLCKINAVLINTPVHICVERRLADNKGSNADWATIIQNMYLGYKRPTTEEGFNNIKIVEDEKWYTLNH